MGALLRGTGHLIMLNYEYLHFKYTTQKLSRCIMPKIVKEKKMKANVVLITILALSLLLSSCAAANVICDPGIRLIVQGLKLTSGLSILEYAEVNFSAPDLRSSVQEVDGQNVCQLRFYGQETDNNALMGIQVNMESGKVTGIDAAGEQMLEQLKEIFIQLPE